MNAASVSLKAIYMSDYVIITKLHKNEYNSFLHTILGCQTVVT